MAISFCSLDSLFYLRISSRSISASSLPPFCQKNRSWVSPSSHTIRRGNLTLGSFQSLFSPIVAAEETTIIPSECTGDLPLDMEESTYVTVHENPEDDRSINDGKDEPEYLSKMVKVCDKLIEVFMVDKPTTSDWRRLLASSKTWSNTRPHFYVRCQERADAESDPGMKHKLLRLSRKLKEIDEDVQRQDELLEVVKEASSEISAVVARRRKDFTQEFFVHLYNVVLSYYENPRKQNELARLAKACLAAMDAYDTATESIETENTAGFDFQDIISSPTISDACKKIDNLAEKSQLDSDQMLINSKAWATAKEIDMTEDEARDQMFHLYQTHLNNQQRLIPKAIRILKQLLTIEDPEELLCGLKDAFTPGPELETEYTVSLYTTPQELHAWMRTILDAYHFCREGTLIRAARDFIEPEVVQRLENLKMLVEKKFL